MRLELVLSTGNGVMLTHSGISPSIEAQYDISERVGVGPTYELVCLGVLALTLLSSDQMPVLKRPMKLSHHLLKHILCQALCALLLSHLIVTIKVDLGMSFVLFYKYKW
jgi:hypothetical protein